MKHERMNSDLMNHDKARRNFLRSSALVATSLATGSAITAVAEKHEPAATPSPVKLGLASYTFRDFSRAQMIGYMKQLNLSALNAKDVKDHLPMEPAQEAAALADYAAAEISLHAIGTVYFPKDEDDDIRSKFEYCKRAGAKVIVAGDPSPQTLPRIKNL